MNNKEKPKMLKIDLVFQKMKLTPMLLLVLEIKKLTDMFQVNRYDSCNCY